jgi:hypothetical protein
MMRVTCINPRLLLLLVLVMAGVESQAHARPKTDVLVMKNGDRITCELLSLSKGQLQIKTDYTVGTVTVNWELVDRIDSSQLFHVELSSGETRNGTLRQEPVQSTDRRLVQISEDLGTSEVDHDEIVMVEQLGTNFWKQLDGSIDVGLSYTTSNSTSQFTVNAGVSRRRERNEFDLSWSSFLSRVEGVEPTNRYELTALYKRLMKWHNWFYGGALDFLKSDQQNLDLRVTPGGVLGRNLVRTNRSNAFIAGGAAVNREWFLEPVDGLTDQTSLEGIVAGSVSIFRFDSTQIDTSLVFFPSLSQWGRYRISFNNSVYLDLWGNLYLRFSFYDDYDSRPQGDTPKNDLGVTTSFGWSF